MHQEAHPVKKDLNAVKIQIVRKEITAPIVQSGLARSGLHPVDIGSVLKILAAQEMAEQMRGLDVPGRDFKIAKNPMHHEPAAQMNPENSGSPEKNQPILANLMVLLQVASRALMEIGRMRNLSFSPD